MTAVAVYTAAFGGFDNLHPQAAQDVDVDWVAFTDDPELEAPDPWRLVVSEARYPHPRMSAKWFKCLPWLSLPHARSIWIDANTEITSPRFAREALAELRDGIALFRHPERRCIYAEAAASLRLAPAKYGHLPILEQVHHYRHLGHPKSAGLYACGTIARDHLDDAVREHGRRWLGECERWTYQDQLSFPVVCSELGITPGVFPFPQIGRRSLANRWQVIHPHHADT